MIAAKEKRIDWYEIAMSLPAYPMFAKPACEGSGKGINRLSKAKTPTELEITLEKLRNNFPGQDILLEPFLAGRDLSVSILGTGSESRVVGVVEFLWKQCRERNGEPFDHCLHISHPPVLVAPSNESEDKPIVYDSCQYGICQDMTEPQVKVACETALRSWKALSCRDAGKVDIRFDSEKDDVTLNVLEVSIIEACFATYSNGH